MTTTTVVQNNKLYDLSFTLQDSEGTAVDISGATVLFKARRVGTKKVTISGGMTVVSGPAGTVRYTVLDGDFGIAGSYDAEIQVTFTPGGKVITFTDIRIDVRPELA